MIYEDSILDKFIINRVSSVEKLNEMKEQGLLQPNQIYLVDGESKVLGLPIGMILPSAIVQNDARLHLLDGAELPRNGIYTEFCNWVDENITNVPNCPIEVYEDQLNTYGQCGMFVVTDTYIRLPKITKYIENASDINMIGASLNAGLPNITGTFDSRPHTSGSTSYGGALADGSGAFSFTKHGATYTGTGTAESSTSSYNDRMSFDASRSSEIYGRSDTVQPEATQYPYYIVIGTVLKTEVEVNIDSIITDLNNKADKNASNLSTANIASWKENLGYENIETIYDMSSSDSSLNWGYTSGIEGGGTTGVTISNKDFSKYKKLLVYYRFWTPTVGKDATSHLEVDLDKLVSSVYSGMNTGYVVFENSWIFMQTILAYVNSAKTSITICGWRNCNSGADATKNVANGKCYKIIGVY